jgi:nucleoside-diphosphate-sugar epimerase
LKALVTGATGFIGSHIAETLLKSGFDVRILARKSSNTKWLDHDKYEIFHADFDDSSSLRNALIGVDYVYHVAGLNFAKNKDDFKNVNTLGTLKLLETIANNDINLKRFVYVSSQTATGPSPSLENPVNELSPRKPVTTYGLSKKMAEDHIISFGEIIPYTIIKPPAVLGPRDTAIFNLFRMMYFGFAAHIGLSPKYISMIHVGDLSRGVVMASIAEIAVNQTYFMANKEFYNWDYISDVFKVQMNRKFYFKIKVPDPIVMTFGSINGFIGGLFNKQPKFDYDKAIDFTQKFWTCSSDKAFNELGFKAEISFEDGIKDTFEWYKSNKWL